MVSPGKKVCININQCCMDNCVSCGCFCNAARYVICLETAKRRSDRLLPFRPWSQFPWEMGLGIPGFGLPSCQSPKSQSPSSPPPHRPPTPPPPPPHRPPTLFLTSQKTRDKEHTVGMRGPWRRCITSGNMPSSGSDCMWLRLEVCSWSLGALCSILSPGAIRSTGPDADRSWALPDEKWWRGCWGPASILKPAIRQAKDSMPLRRKRTPIP